MIARSHYDRVALEQFLNEAPPESDSDIAVHLEQCQECQSTLESLFGEGLTMEAAGELLRDRAAEYLTWDPISSDRLTEIDRSTFLEPSEHPGSLGRFSRFEIMEFLGRGGMGIVMRGFDTSLNRHSAVKVLAPELATSAAARKRFSREAKSAAAVVHPHVVPIQTVDQHNGLPYLVMPVVEGQSVDARVRGSGPLSVIEAVRIAAQIAEGLAAAHGQGLVHRDIKPANVLLENGVERVQITDFGLARAIDDASMTRSGVIAGTPQYMSPEQAHGDSIDHRSDLFSLGSLIYFMLTGHSPFRAETTMGVLNRIGNEQPRSLRSINADMPEWFEQIVMKLLAKPREDRFQSAAEVAELLQRWHAHLQQPEMVQPPQKVSRKSRLATNAAGSRGGLVKWLIATAAFGFLAFAGALIVLELEKGKLIIESEAGDVPIRIMQGDEIVKRLTVTKTGTSVRVASGKYVVLIEGEFSDIHVDSDTVTLGRREKKTVRIVQSIGRAETVASGEKELSSEALNGVLTPKQVWNHGQQISKLKDSISVRFRVGTAATQAYDGIDDQRWYLCSDDNPSELGTGVLKVWISPALEDALQEQGITDLGKHFAGKAVTVSGQVEASAVMLLGRPTSWVYSMQLETLDQLTVWTVQSSERAELFANPNIELGPQERPEILTPEQAMNHGQLQVLAMERGLPQKWVDASVTVRFRVGSVARQIRYADYLAWYLCPSEKPSELGAGFLKIWISPAAEAALKEKGITDLEAHFAGKKVSISGRVTSFPALLSGTLNSTSRFGPSHLIHSMELETLDQLTFPEAPSKDLGGKRFNTPTVLAALRGRWQEIQDEEGEDFHQTLVFAGGALGQWYQSAQTLPVNITYYVEGTELILQFNHEPEATFDYRMKQLRFEYKLDGDSLLLTREGVTTRLQRIREPIAAKTPAPAQPNPYAPEFGYAQSYNQFVGGNSLPTPVNTLAGFVRHFNHTIQLADLDAPPQPPLTVEELRSFAQWKLQTDKQLSVETKGVLTDIGIGGWLPKHWEIEGRESQVKTGDGEIGIYAIDLVSQYSDTKIVVRQRFLSAPVNFHGPRRPTPMETATPLEAAITEFNAIHHDVDGMPQPSLTLEEVLAAILDWKSRRNEAPVDNKTFANFQELALTHQLPADAKIEVLSRFKTEPGDDFKIWSVRIVMPQVAKPGSSMAFTIREQFLSVNSFMESAIHWGKPNDDGLQAGFRLIPGQRAYQVGTPIETEFCYRSISGKSIPASLPNLVVHQKLIARDAKGKDLDVVELQDRMVGGAMQTQIGETPVSKRGKPLDLGFITPDPKYDSISPNETYLTVKDGQKVSLSYVVSDLNGGELRTGELVIDIAETLADPRF